MSAAFFAESDERRWALIDMIWIGATSVPSLYLRNFFYLFLSSCEVRHSSEKGHGHTHFERVKSFFCLDDFILSSSNPRSVKLIQTLKLFWIVFFFSVDRLLLWFLHEKYCGGWRVTMPRRKQQEPRRSAGKRLSQLSSLKAIIEIPTKIDLFHFIISLSICSEFHAPLALLSIFVEIRYSIPNYDF